MLSKNKIKLIRSLKLKKNREKYHLTIVEGSKIIGELADQDSVLIQEVWHTKAVERARFSILKTNNIIHEIDNNEMRSISLLESIPDALALVNFPQEKVDDSGQKLILFLDDVQDPGNVGTIIRTAEWFGHSTIICSPRCADRYSTKVVQASMGSTFRVQIKIREWIQLKKDFPDHDLAFADMVGENINTWVNNANKSIVVIGNEGNGVADTIKSSSAKAINIKGSKTKKTESLNASIAAGIILHCWGPLN